MPWKHQLGAVPPLPQSSLGTGVTLLMLSLTRLSPSGRTVNGPLDVLPLGTVTL